MSDIKVNQAQPAQSVDKELKSAGRGALDNLKTIRNVAAGAAVTGLAAMGAEALGVVTLPATIPTGMLTLAAGGVAGVTGMIVMIGEGVDKLISDAHSQQEKALGQ